MIIIKYIIYIGFYQVHCFHMVCIYQLDCIRIGWQDTLCNQPKIRKTHPVRSLPNGIQDILTLSFSSFTNTSSNLKFREQFNQAFFIIVLHHYIYTYNVLCNASLLTLFPREYIFNISSVTSVYWRPWRDCAVISCKSGWMLTHISVGSAFFARYPSAIYKFDRWWTI